MKIEKCKFCGSEKIDKQIKSNNLVCNCSNCGKFLGNEPQNEPTLYFGKYKGCKIKEMTTIEQTQYLNWLLQSDIKITATLKTAIESQLNTKETTKTISLKELISAQHRKPRELTVERYANLGIQREYNHLRIINLNDFFNTYTNNLEYYNAPFRILSDLENEILFKNEPDKCITIPYKPDGCVVFDLVEIKIENKLRIVVYQFSTTAS